MFGSFLIRVCEAIDVVIQTHPIMNKQPLAPVQLCLSVDKRISLILKDIKQSRQPLAMEAVKKIEEAQYLLESLQQAGGIKSVTARSAIDDLLAKF